MIDSTTLTPQQIAVHLAKPDGELGKAVAEWMNKNNLLFSKAAYSHLQIDHGDRVLEIGPGNGALVGFIVTNDNAVAYKAIDISQTMIDAARQNNAEMVARGRVDFLLAPAERIPFPDDAFDRVVTVNCIYFWDIPKALREIHRVLVNGGRLVVASNSPDTMNANPLLRSGNGFRNIDLDRDALRKFHAEAGFSKVTIEDYAEETRRMDGTPFVRRSFLTIAVK